MDDDWHRVANAINAEMDRRNWTRAELIRFSGVGGDTIDAYRQAAPVKRKDKERGICDAFEWPPDMLRRIAQGEDPPPPLTNLTRHDADRIAAVEAGLARVLAGVDEILRRLPDDVDTQPRR